MSFKVIIAGSRSFHDYDLLKRKMDNYLRNKNKDEIIIVSGTARGADKLGEKYATDNNFELMKFPAKWKLHGKGAGYIRNEEMAKYADACVLFWNGETAGTNNMKENAEKYNLQLRIVYF
jgi:hypothetical protein